MQLMPESGVLATEADGACHIMSNSCTNSPPSCRRRPAGEVVLRIYHMVLRSQSDI